MKTLSTPNDLAKTLARISISDSPRSVNEAGTPDTQPTRAVHSAVVSERKNRLGLVLCHGESITKGNEACERHGNYKYEYESESTTKPLYFCYDHHPDHSDKQCHAVVEKSKTVKEARQCARVSNGGRDAETGRPICGTHVKHKPARLIFLEHEQ